MTVSMNLNVAWHMRRIRLPEKDIQYSPVQREDAKKVNMTLVALVVHLLVRLVRGRETVSTIQSFQERDIHSLDYQRASRH
jgi:hypothetical protein